MRLPVVPVLLAFALIACSAPSSTAMAQEIARIPLQPAPPGAPVLVLSVGSVQNPDRLAISLGLFLGQIGRQAAIQDVGTVSLFPSDQPGRFLVRVSAATMAATRAPGARNELVVRLLPQPGQPAGAAPMLRDIGANWIQEPR